jgi:hypothetical protein
MNWGCLIHGHEIIRYDRQLAWECIRCLKQWPMSKELVSASGVYAKKNEGKEALQLEPARSANAFALQTSGSALQKSGANLQNPRPGNKRFWRFKKGQSSQIRR